MECCRVFARPTLIPLVALLWGCAPGQGPGQSAATQPAVPDRALSIVIRLEPTDLTVSGGDYARIAVALFGAGLGAKDQHEIPYPVLADALPQLDTDSWRVEPSGRMETRFQLRPGLTWHDGTPLEAEDFAFGFQADQARIKAGSGPRSDLNADLVNRLESITAAGPSTLVMGWREPYAEAATPYVMARPRHLLKESFDQGTIESFTRDAYWTTAYVGLGPYRLTRWEPGVFIEARGFDGYALGRPRIERVVLTWSGDPNATLTRLLAGDATSRSTWESTSSKPRCCARTGSRARDPSS